MADLRETVTRLFDAMNNKDFETIRSHLDPDFVYIGPDDQEARGIEAGLQAGWVDHSEGFPDVRIEVKDVYVAGDTVTTEFHFSGTHRGTWAGVAPTGKRVEGDVCNVMQFRNGKLVRERDYVNTLGIFMQLGVVQMP
jgi:ketosteroid isomerase-like protein